VLYETVSDIYIGFYDIDKNIRYVISNGDKTEIMNVLNTHDSTPGFTELNTTFIDAAISNVELTEGMNVPNTCTITGYFNQGNEENSSKNFSFLADEIINKLNAVIVFQVYKNIEGVHERSTYHFHFKLINAQTQQNMLEELGFTLVCVHWLEIFKNIPVAHIASLNNGRLIPFFSGDGISLFHEAQRIRTGNQYIVPGSIFSLKEEVRQLIISLIKGGDLSILASIFEAVVKHVEGITQQVEDETVVHSRYQGKKALRELVLRYKDTTQNLIDKELGAMFTYLKNELKNFQLQPITAQLGSEEETIQELTATILNGVNNLSWFDFIVYVLNIFSINLMFDLSSLEEMEETSEVVRKHVLPQMIEMLGIAFLDAKLIWKTFLPSVVKNEPFYELDPTDISPLLLSSNLNIPTTNPFTRILFVPPASTMESLYNASSVAENYNILIPSVEKDQYADLVLWNDANTEEENFGLKLVISGVDRWMGILLRLYLKKFDNKSWMQKRSDELKKNIDNYETELTANLAKAETERSKLEKLFIKIGEPTSIFSMSNEDFQKNLANEVQDYIDNPEHLEEVKAILEHKNIMVNIDTYTTDSETDKERIKTWHAVQDVSTRRVLSRDFYELFKEMNLEKLDQLNVLLAEQQAELAAFKTEYDKYIVDLQSDEQIKKMVYFLYYMNRYSANNGSIVIPIFGSEDILGKVINLNNQYCAHVRSASYSFDASGNIVTKFDLAYVIKYGFHHEVALKNPVLTS
jgi:hypothetical protein